jgi:long-chain acyl-CoA synthetase
MKYRQFGDFVASFSNYPGQRALTIRPFLKIEHLSYGELQTHAYQTAQYLLSRGIKSGDRVMVVAANSPEWIVLFFGVQLIGAILVPVDVAGTLDTVLHFAKQTEPKLIFRNRHAQVELDKKFTTCVLDELDEHIANCPPTAPEHKLQGDETALIVFTSGTTADPKGVVLTQTNVLANVQGVQQALIIDPDWRLLSVLPLSHMYELTGTLAVLSSGASIYYVPRVTPLAIAGALQEYRITTILAIPQLLILLLERIRQGAALEGKTKTLAVATKIARALPFATRRLLFAGVHKRLGGSLNLVVTGGAPIPVEVAKTWERMGVKTLQGYGLTETSPILTANRLDNHRLDSQGLALHNVDLRIGKDNEIQAKGPSIFGGYWQNEQATRAAFTPDGWFKTGDVGRLDSGWLRIQGRIKFAIVLSSGLKVFPEDVEVAAEGHAVFKAICVVGINRPEGEAVEAVIISDKSDREITEAVTKINQRLASFQHISNWRRWPDSDFPRTRLLKIDRKRVWEWANGEAPTKVADKKQAAQSSDQLLDIIRASLDEPNAGIKDTDRLADIGLDSLRRLSVVASIEEQLGIAVAEEHVTQATTVGKLRKLVDHGDPVEPPKPRPTWPYRRLTRLVGNGLRDVVFRGILRIWIKIKVDDQAQLDKLNTPALFIFNHVDNFDAPVLYRALPRRVRRQLAVAHADDVMREHKVLAFVSRLCYAGFNLARHEPYMPSLEYVAKMIDAGWNVALAPEGRMSKNGQLQPFKSGIGLLAAELGVAVVPVKTIGLYGTVPLHANWPKHRSHVTVRIGQPVKFARHTDYDKATRKLQQLMESL